jgi:hypothetical protein
MSNTPTPNNNDNNNNDLLYWLITIIAFIACWPIGLILLFRKLGESGQKGRSQRNRNGSGRGQLNLDPNAAQVERGGAKGGRAAKKLKAHPGRGFLIGGGIVTAIFGFSTLMEFLDWVTIDLFYAMQESAPLFFFTGVGVALMLWGRKLNRRNREFRKLLSMVGKQDAVDIEALAKAAGTSYDRVAETLQDMIDAGLFGDYAFLDLSEGRLVLTSDGLNQPVRKKEPEKKPEPAPAQSDDALLLQIRAANDAIADPVMSAKIDRIESITRRILACQKEHPERAGQLRSFLNYYLPTTLKILNSYAEMANQGIEGENITAAKSRIEAMMDKVVEGFEKQLDKLYADDLLDITSDISVMEKMMAKDGLSGGSEFHVEPTPAPWTTGSSFTGSAAVQAAPEADQEIDPTDTWR